ncbi:MAG: rRNA pseudouridine synthase [Anaerofustis stercorihominis]|nr:rRNA pseudouridine synthase [Anaerofustis stercorihominis]
MRINKYLAGCGVASRRKCEEYILMGKIKVNGRVMKDLAYDVDEKNDVVTFNDKPLKYEEQAVYYMLNKPKGVISAAKSKYGETTVVDLIEGEKSRIYPIGRLDKDTTGLIFLTNDGNLSYKLTHPKFEKEKTYEALVKGKVDNDDMNKLKKGVVSSDELLKASYVRLIRMVKGDSLLQITLREGKKRQVRRMCDCIGHSVIELKRISEGGIDLGELKPGEYRKLTAKEVKKLIGGK